MQQKIKLIINPTAGNHRASKSWPDLRGRLERRFGNFAYDFTKAPNDAIALTRAALRAGFETIVAVGGDGTINEVVNGFFEDGKKINPGGKLGIISMGTGGDLIRTLKLHKSVDEVARRIFENEAQPCDLCLLKCVGPHGDRVARYFINIADAGFGAEVANRVNRSSKALGHLFAYLTGLLRTLRTYENKLMRIRVDDHFSKEQVVNAVIIANGQFFGGGMWVAPSADLHNGQLEVVILGDISRTQAVMNVPKVYRGTLSQHAKVTTLRGRKIVLESAETVMIEADGELPGMLPASFEVLPGAMNLVT